MLDKPLIHDALSTVAREVLTYLSRSAQGPFFVSTWRFSYVRHSEDEFGPRQTRIWVDSYRHVLPILAQIESMLQLRAAIQQDTDLHYRFDTLVGTWRQKGRRELNSWIVEKIIAPLVMESESYAVDEDHLSSLCKGFIADSLRNTGRVITFVPICGLSTDLTDVEIAPSLKLRVMSDSEINLAMTFSAIPSNPGGPIGLIRVARPNQLALVSEATLPLEFTEEIDNPVSTADVLPDAKLLVYALRICCGGSITETRQLVMDEDFGTGGTSLIPWVHPVERSPCALTAEKLPDVLQTFQSLKKLSGGNKKDLNIALRRIVEASLRQDSIDRLTDLTIGAEAIFGDSLPGEITFKISIRAALLFRHERYKNRTSNDIRRFMSEVYRQRSKIVHGGAPSKAKRLDGSNAETVDHLVCDLDSLMRKSLSLVIAERANADPNTPPRTWDEKLGDLLDSDIAEIEEDDIE